MTLETDAALRQCRQLLVLHHDHLVHDYLSGHYAPVVDLDSFYVEDAAREITYERIASTVIEAAQQCVPIAFVTYGHPWVYVRPTELIVRGCERRGLTCKVLPGISALDGLLVDLGLDPGVDGLQMYGATDLLLRRRPLQPDVACLIWQVGAIGRVVQDDSRLPTQQVRRLQDYLTQFYPQEHEVILARTPSVPTASPRRSAVSLKDLSNHASRMGSADTLFIPRVEKRPIMDWSVLENSASRRAMENSEFGTARKRV